MDESFKDRVRGEREALKHKIERLQQFIGTSMWYRLTDAERVRLRAQNVHQVQYLSILDARLAADFQ